LYGPNQLAKFSLLLGYFFRLPHNETTKSFGSQSIDRNISSIMRRLNPIPCFTLLFLVTPALVRAHEHHHHGDRRLRELLAQTPEGCGFHEPAVHEIYQLQAEQEERVARVEEERFALQQRQYEQQQGGCSISFGGGGSAWNPGDDTDTGGGGGSDGGDDSGSGGGGNWNSQVSIPTYVHAVSRTNGEGFLSDSTLNQSIQLANSLLSSAGFQINVISINRAQNDNWFQAQSGSAEEREMQAQLKRGGLNTLNIYFKLAVSGSSRFCGYAYLAEDAAAVGNGDGVTIDINCALDRTTVAHEVGTFSNPRPS
jgi:hypothetical protein